MKQSWSAYASAKLPRYTSYPTAADFSDEVTADLVEGWVAELPDGKPISVYSHIPFCDQLCWYCGCATNVVNGYDRVQRFVGTLKAEIELWRDRLPSGTGIGIGHLHFGGGSPNALSPRDFEEISAKIKSVFGVWPDMEFGVELDPRKLTDDFIEAMGRSGVTRASLGVQTLSPVVQAAVNRIQPRWKVSGAIASLRRNGIRNINMDLMYGLPRQTLDDVREAAVYAVDVGTSRVAVFGYVPWFAKHQRAIDASALPGLSERFAQAQAAREVFEAAGYIPVGLDHFARPDDLLAEAARTGHLHRNFQGYTVDPHDTLIGLGPSSISQYRAGFAQSHRQLKDWQDAVETNNLPITRGITLSDADRLVGRAIEVLMCRLSIDTSDVCAEFGVPASELDFAIERAQTLVADGLCIIEERTIRIPEDARIMMRTVAACFDIRRQHTTTRHATAV